MKREAIEDDYKDADVWHNDVLVMNKGKVRDSMFAQRKHEMIDKILTLLDF